MYDLQTIKQQATGRWLDIFSYVAGEKLSDAVKKCPKHVPCPVNGGKDGFRLFQDAADTGASVSNKDGVFGDGFATLMFATNQSFKEVLAEVADFLGIEREGNTKKPVKKPVMQCVDASPNQVRSATQFLPEEEVEKRRAKLNGYWSQSSKIENSRSGRAIQYLKSRGITKTFILECSDFRFHPATWYVLDGEHFQTPAFIQLWRKADGTAVNIHKILLDKNGVGKAKLEKSKLMMRPSDSMTGGAIRIGEPAFGTLSVSTGVETALSVTEVTGRPCWSVLSDSLLRGFIPPQDITHLTIWADNDKPDSKGRNSGVESAIALQERLSADRPEIKVIIKLPPVPGKDWNDHLIEGDKQAFYGNTLETGD